jgi:hypothetical protein
VNAVFFAIITGVANPDLVLEVYGMDEYGQITCRKPDGYLTTRMKPEELEKL